jgi:hypothetical protein
MAESCLYCHRAVCLSSPHEATVTLRQKCDEIAAKGYEGFTFA